MFFLTLYCLWLAAPAWEIMEFAVQRALCAAAYQNTLRRIKEENLLLALTAVTDSLEELYWAMSYQGTPFRNVYRQRTAEVVGLARQLIALRTEGPEEFDHQAAASQWPFDKEGQVKP